MDLRSGLLPCLAVVLAVSPALASDGVREINQACASGPGCFAGDTPGLPVEITGVAGRSYRLTSDLVSNDVAVGGVVFSGSASGFTLDLGGFAIRGPVTCSGSPNQCGASGSGDGVSRATNSTASGITVRNGAITGMGGNGVGLLLVDECVVEDVLVRENGRLGVAVGAASRVQEVTAVRNGSSGIAVGEASLVTGSTASQNGLRGISGSGANSLYVGNTIHDNFDEGLVGSSGTNIARSSVRANGATGIRPGSGALVLENSIVANGDATVGDGVTCGSGCRIHGNAVRLNVDTGLEFSLDGAYSDNTITNNTVRAVDTGGTPRGGNFCSGPGVGVATCP